MSRSILLFLSLTFSITTTILAQTAARANTCCGLMSGKVYCYGGLVYTSTTANKADNTMNVLDITDGNGTSSDDLQNMWKSVSYIPNDVDLSARTDPQCLVYDDQNRMIINGGYSSSTKQLNNMNIIYNALQNTWYARSPYSESPYGKRQIYYGSASYVPGKGAAFYGGFEVYVNSTWTVPYTNTSIFSFSNGQSTTIGYTQVSYFDPDNNSSVWNTPVSLTTDVDRFSARHASVFDPVNNLLLFMGGEYRNSNPPSQNAVQSPYSYIKAFNTETNTWSFVNLTGDVPTAGRFYSTLTLLPSTNRHVLLYGGEIGGSVVLNYCYVLNLDTKNWTRQTIEAPPGTTLARSRHSSVLVNNNTLFVMWGIDSNNVGISSVLILNTTDPDAITMSTTYIDPNVKIVEDDNSGLSSGAKAGIAVGCVAVAILGALVIWFCIRNKRKNEKTRTQQQELTEQQQSEYYNRSDVEPMEVDWDQIENKYMEMPTIGLGNNTTTTGTEKFGASPSSVASTTIVNGGDNSLASPAVHPDGVEVHHPHTIDSPNVQTSIQPPRVLKPDGGY